MGDCILPEEPEYFTSYLFSIICKLSKSIRPTERPTFLHCCTSLQNSLSVWCVPRFLRHIQSPNKRYRSILSLRKNQRKDQSRARHGPHCPARALCCQASFRARLFEHFLPTPFRPIRRAIWHVCLISLEPSTWASQVLAVYRIM